MKYDKHVEVFQRLADESKIRVDVMTDASGVPYFHNRISDSSSVSSWPTYCHSVDTKTSLKRFIDDSKSALYTHLKLVEEVTEGEVAQ